MITVELTEQEALSLRNLLDIAVKAGGMRAAEFALPIDAKILAAAQVATKSNGNADDRPAL